MKTWFQRIYLFWLKETQPLVYARHLGVRMGKDCKIVSLGRSTFGSEPYLIELGDHVEIAGEVSFLTHDGGAWVFRDRHPDLDVVAPVKVGNNVFIGRRATILPGTDIGDNCVIGAGAVVKGKLEPNGVYAGVPARRIRDLESYREILLQRDLGCKRMKSEEKKRFLLEHFNAQNMEDQA